MKCSFAYLFFIFASSCAHNSLEINSIPSGAAVYSYKGELLGKTPLALKADQIQQIAENNVLNIKVSNPGYLPRIIIADIQETRKISITLPLSNSKVFSGEFSNDFSSEHNKMIRDAFKIQKSFFEKNYSETEKQLDSYKITYPALAFPHIMSATLHLSQGKREAAFVDLKKAEALDPNDTSIQQMLNIINRPDPGTGGAR